LTENEEQRRKEGKERVGRGKS
jgi:hypothetical protein